MMIGVTDSFPALFFQSLHFGYRIVYSPDSKASPQHYPIKVLLVRWLTLNWAPFFIRLDTERSPIEQKLTTKHRVTLRFRHRAYFPISLPMITHHASSEYLNVELGSTCHALALDLASYQKVGSLSLSRLKRKETLNETLLLVYQ